VQARPITTLGIAGVEAGDGFDSTIGTDDTYTTAGIAESMPGVLRPLQWTTAGPLIENGFRHLFDQMGALPAQADDTRFLARVHGRAVLSLDLMKAAALDVPGGSSDEIERQYFGRVISSADDGAVESKTASGPFKGLRSMLAGVREINARRQFRFEADASIDTIERLLLDPPDCETASAAQLLAYRHRALDLADRVMAAEVAVAASAAAAYRGVELFLEPYVGGDAARLAQQLTAGGINPCGAQVALRTCALVERALADAELASAVEGLSARDAAARDTLARVGAGCGLIAEVDAELARAGSAAVFSGETWAESEDLAWQLLSQAVQVERRGRPEMTQPDDRTILLAEVESRFSTSWKYRMQRVMTGQIVDLRKRMLRRLVADAVEFLHLREKTKSAVLALGGEVRRIHLAIGRHLVVAGVFERAADVDLLAAYELEPSLDGDTPTWWELTRRRAALERLRDAEPIPQIFTGDPSRQVGEVAPSDGNSFTGWAASAGVYEGTARVITKASEPIEPGDIIVARSTDPAWTPLFLTAGAIVVEEGGPLSHAAIIARELGLPAVLNVPGFLALLDGATTVTLRVDGDHGTVEILDDTTTPNPERAETFAS
jgi:pyruvate,water dikinase